MVFYIAVIIFHNQHQSIPISMVFYIAVIIFLYDSLILALMLYVTATHSFLFFLAKPAVYTAV
jgi:hypothetical protein